MKIKLYTSGLDPDREAQIQKVCDWLSGWVQEKTNSGLVWAFDVSQTNQTFSLTSGKGMNGFNNSPLVVSYIDPDEIPLDPLSEATGLVYAPENYQSVYPIVPVEFSGKCFEVVFVKDENFNVLRDYLCHEILHKCFDLAKIPDTVHQHSGIDDPRPEANYVDCLNQLKSWWSQKPNNTDDVSKMVQLVSILTELVGLYKLLLGHKSRINDWANAIKSFEGWYPGSRSYRNNNPGNLKYAGQIGATGKDDQGHTVFALYQDGWDALVKQLTIAANGKSKVYSPTMTLTDFFGVYAEANQKPYASFVARQLGVPESTQIKDLL